MPLQSKVILFFILLMALIIFQWLFFIEHEARVLREEMADRAGVLAKTLAQLSKESIITFQITRLERQK